MACQALIRPVAIVGAMVAGSLLAACSGGPSVPGVASLNNGATHHAKTSSYAHTPLGFSLCMRAHGVPDFPEPGAGGALAITAKAGVDAQSPAFQRALRDCRSLIGGAISPAQQAAIETQALRFARCMRAHGVTDFPDPVALGSGGFGFQSRVHGSLNPNNPVFRSAIEACSKSVKGVFRTR